MQEYIEVLLDSGQKFLAFAHHTCLMDAIEHACNRHKGCRFIRIDGRTPPADRQRLVQSFQDNEGALAGVGWRGGGGRGAGQEQLGVGQATRSAGALRNRAHTRAPTAPPPSPPPTPHARAQMCAWPFCPLGPRGWG